jgi:hypothetical protein
MPRPNRRTPQTNPEPVLTFTQEKFDRIIGERVAVIRAKLGPKAAAADQYRDALALAMTRIAGLEEQVRSLGAVPVVTLPEDAPAADLEPEPEDVEPEEPAQPPRGWSAEEFAGSAADRVAARLART